MFRGEGLDGVLTPVIGAGWLGLLEKLAESIDRELGIANRPAFRFTDIKSKYGGLRISSVLSTDDRALEARIEGIITEAEDASESVCETCGAPGRQVTRGGWISTACEKHEGGGEGT
jgi:hypothetical protein